MSYDQIVRAWKNEKYPFSLSEAERAGLPAMRRERIDGYRDRQAGG